MFYISANIKVLIISFLFSLVSSTLLIDVVTKNMSIKAAGEPLYVNAPTALGGEGDTISAPKFIDNSNSAYYLDPAGSTSLLVAGNVGIGDTSPASLFTVGSGDLFQVNSSGAITAVTSISATGVISTTRDGTSNAISVTTTGAAGVASMSINDRTGGIILLRGDANDSYIYGGATGTGQFGIGTKTPAQMLDVVGTIRQSTCKTAGTLSANTSGDIICTSDARLKNILGDYTGGINELMQISPQLFTYKTTPENPIETFEHAGFIAQNVKSVIPQASALQDNGYYSLDTTAILAAVVNGIKEQQTQIIKLSNKIDSQQKQIDELKKAIEALENR